METINGHRKKRFIDELNKLEGFVSKDSYKKFYHPFPEFTPEPGAYDNNIGIVARFDFESPIEIDGQLLIGTAYEFCYIRDDRENKKDPSTKHINVNYRILGKNIDGEIVQGSYTKENHFISPVLGTSLAHIENNMNITDLNEKGPNAELFDRGLIMKLGDK